MQPCQGEAVRGLHGLKTEARTRPVPEIVWPDPTRAAQLNLEPEPDPKSPELIIYLRERDRPIDRASERETEQARDRGKLRVHVNLRLRVSLYKRWGLVISKTAILPPHCR